MSDKSNLQEFEIAVDWHMLQRPKIERVIARNVDDAKEIARLLFTKGHTEACFIVNVREVKAP